MLASPPTAELQERAKKALYVAIGRDVATLRKEAEQANKPTANEIERQIDRLRQAEDEAVKLIDSEETEAGFTAMWSAAVRRIAAKNGDEACLPPAEPLAKEVPFRDLMGLCRYLEFIAAGKSQMVAETTREFVEGEIAARVKAAQANCGPEASWPDIVKLVDEYQRKEHERTKKKPTDAEAFAKLKIARRFPHVFPGGITPKEAAERIQRNRSRLKRQRKQK